MFGCVSMGGGGIKLANSLEANQKYTPSQAIHYLVRIGALGKRTKRSRLPILVEPGLRSHNRFDSFGWKFPQIRLGSEQANLNFIVTMKSSDTVLKVKRS